LPGDVRRTEPEVSVVRNGRTWGIPVAIVAGRDEPQPVEVTEKLRWTDPEGEDHHAVELIPMASMEATTVLDGADQGHTLLPHRPGRVARAPGFGEVELVACMVAAVVAGGQHVRVCPQAPDYCRLRQTQFSRHRRNSHVEALIAGLIEQHLIR